MIIETEEQFDTAVARVEEIFDTECPELCQELDELCAAIEAYEDIHCPLEPLTPEEMAAFRAEQECMA